MYAMCACMCVHACVCTKAHTCVLEIKLILAEYYACTQAELPLSSFFFQLPPHFHSNYLGLYFSLLFISFDCLINIFFIKNYLVWNQMLQGDFRPRCKKKTATAPCLDLRFEWAGLNQELPGTLRPFCTKGHMMPRV